MKFFIKYKIRFAVILSLFLCFEARSQDIDTDFDKVTGFIQALRMFSKNIPQEKVYLHFDNTSYYQGDNIWFKCYVVTSAQHQLSQLSKTLYVELLNPGGEIIDKRILKIENGQCHGDFVLNQLTLYSGFYEVRAYTKYMLNFGDDAIFSRLLPVFNKPKTEGDFEEKTMLSYNRYGTRNRPMKRESPEKGRAVNVRFFPEGGNLIEGVASRVAFEATDQIGNPIEITGVITDGNQQELCQITTLHEGRGVFTYTPAVNTDRRKDIARVEYSGRKYSFDMPQGLLLGLAMEVNSLTGSDSISITLRKNSSTPAEMLGTAVLSGGKLHNYCCVWMEKDEVSFQMDKAQLPSGVARVVLFNTKGEILCDRLLFADRENERLDVRMKTGKPTHKPYEQVAMELSVSDREMNPVSANFSLSVRDGTNEVENNHNILTDLLLMSEIKGYVSNPSWYFTDDHDGMRREALDVLLMVQSWRRNSWKQMVGVEPFELKYLPEQGIETHGTIIQYPLFGKPRPRPNVDVDLFLHRRGEEDIKSGGALAERFVTDDDGRFSFALDVQDKWSMVLSAKENGKPKGYGILLDRVFSPEPKRYRYADLQVNIAENNTANEPVDDESFDENIEEEDWDSFLTVYNDSIAKLGIEEKIHLLPEVTVRARRTKEQEIYQNRSTSVAYYDVASESDELYDRGVFIGDNLHDLLKNMNENFL